MPDQLSANSSLDTLPRRPRPGGDEPEFNLRGAPRDPPPFSDSEGEERIRVASSPDAVQSRDHRTAVALPVGSLLYLVLVGFVAVATIGVFFGAGFLLLAHPEMQTIADPGTRDRAPSRPDGNAPRADREAAPNSPAVASLPASPLAPHAAVAEMPAPEQSTATQDTPPLPSSEQPPARTASEPETPSSPPVSPIPTAPSVSPAPSAAEDAVLPGGTKRRPTHHGRSHYARSASRHSYPRSSGNTQYLTPPQSPGTRHLAGPRTGQAGSFDQLLGQLTGPAKPAAGSLTPPRGQ